MKVDEKRLESKTLFPKIGKNPRGCRLFWMPLRPIAETG
jgi:hypothetical protein